MAHSSLNDHAHNQKLLSALELRDKLYEELRQAKALIVLANGQDFLNNDKVIVHDYLLLLEDVMLAAIATYNALDKKLDACKG